MRIGMNLPVMARGLDRECFVTWCRGIDDGPFYTLAAGERVAFHNPDIIAALGAAAVLTERVKLALTVLVAPMHDPVEMAKQVATLDVLSGGRVVLGVGVGGREEDYEAIGATFDAYRLTRTERAVARMREVWAQETVVEGAYPVGPAPVQEGGPQILSGSLMQKSIERAAKWSDGLTTFDFGPNPSVMKFQIETAKRAFAEAGREKTPYLQTACWYGLSDDADDQIAGYLGEYLRFLGPKVPKQVAPMVRARSADALASVMDELEEMGIDELLLVPTSADPRELERAAEVIAQRA